MKKICLILTFLALNCLKAHSQCDSVYTWLQFTTSDDEEIKKNVVYYSSTGKITSSLQYIYSYPDYQWKNYRRELYTYDTNDSLIHDLIQSCSDTTWINSFQTLYSYDSFGNTILK